MESFLEINVLNTMLNRYGLTATTPDEYFDAVSQLESIALWDNPVNLKRDSEIYLMLNLLKKSECLIEDANKPKLAALRTWYCTEARNGYTNFRLDANPYLFKEAYLRDIIPRAIHIAQEYMGKCPSYDELMRNAEWPTGATAEKARRKPVDECLKSVNKIHEGAGILARGFLNGYHTSVYGKTVEHNHFAISNCSKMDMVPKTYKVSRVIEKGHAVMVALQKSCGSILKSRLRKKGIDLRTQTDINRDLVKLSIANKTCTIDLKEASDSVTISLVKLFVSEEWFELLSILRNSHTKTVTGETICLEKFSANGNGFTFELETIIFRAITEATCEFCDINYPRNLVATFGDDIICPVNAARLLMKVLNFCGFIVNKEKSYVDGNFYESCGSHYAFNVYVTPVYFKEKLTTLQQYIVAYNKLYKWSSRYGNFSFTRKALLLIKQTAIAKFSLFPKRIKVKGQWMLWDTIPQQPLAMQGDFGFISESPGVYFLKGGCITLLTALVKRAIVEPVEREWFYYQNVLRGGTSFYSELAVDSETQEVSLGRTDPDCTSATIKRNYKVFESNLSMVRPERWLPSNVSTNHQLDLCSWLPSIDCGRRISRKVLFDLWLN